jgi:hypothetical protein
VNISNVVCQYSIKAKCETVHACMSGSTTELGVVPRPWFTGPLARRILLSTAPDSFVRRASSKITMSASSVSSLRTRWPNLDTMLSYWKAFSHDQRCRR